MSKPVTIKNDHLHLTTVPNVGGKVTSIIDLADGYELLCLPVGAAPESSQYGMNYRDAWAGGWDECFPTVNPSIYPLAPYEGIAIPDHGEVWSLPTTAVPTKNGITNVWHGLRFGYRLTRKLYLLEHSIVAEYTLINLAPFPFYFAWSPQINLSGQPRCDFVRDQNIARVPIQSPLKFEYPNRKRSLTMTYSSAQCDAYWCVISNDHTTAGPIMGRSMDLNESIQSESAAMIDASGRAEWRFELSVK